MVKKLKNVCTVLNYTEHLLILATVVTRFISIYAFVSLVGIVIGITCSAIGLKICNNSRN